MAVQKARHRAARTMPVRQWLQFGAAAAVAGVGVLAAQSVANADASGNTTESSASPATANSAPTTNSTPATNRGPVKRVFPTSAASGRQQANSPAQSILPRFQSRRTQSDSAAPQLDAAALPREVSPNLATTQAGVKVLQPQPITQSSAELTTRELPADVATMIATTNNFINTYVNLNEWWNGSFIVPKAIRQIFFNQTPVASPMNVEVDLAAGVTSAPIQLRAYDDDGNALIYSVAPRGLPGGPTRGTVIVDPVRGTFTYTPDEDFVGTDTFSFIVNDDTSPHVHAWENLFNGAFSFANTGLDGGHRTTATVTIFNNVDVQPSPGIFTDITGNFRVLTYNVAGQPFPISGGPWPRIPNMVEIGSLLNGYDIVNVQQDVAYHAFLLAQTTFPDQTAPQVPTWLWSAGLPFSDGLNSFSAYDIESLSRQKWAGCATTCPAPMGFTYSRMHIPGGSSVDVYNIDSNEAAWTNSDIAQLSQYIAANSVGRAVIVTGDFGQLYSDSGQTLTEFATANGLTDAWVQLQYGGITPTDAATCAYANSCEQTDKIFYRNSAPLNPNDPTTSPVQLQAQIYTNEGLSFRNAFGQDLSDHRPQSVTFTYSVDPVGPLNVDLANWMANMPSLANLPFTQIPIPGTHDSGTYGISPSSEWALTGVDEYGVLTKLPQFIQDLIVKPIVSGWARTQSKNLYDQMTDGIRYVDLRLSNEPDGQIYIEHALRGPQIDSVIDDISRFVHEHPKEMVIVYAQEFTNFSPATHDAFVAQLESAFGDRMAPRSLTTSATLNDLWSIDKNVIVVYNNASTVSDDANLWYDSTLYRPWADVPSMDQLYTANLQNLATRPPGSIWGLFGEPTEDESNVIMGIALLGPTSEKHYISNTHRTVQQWLRVDFKDTLNLVTDDWYQLNWPVGSTYARDVISAVYETLGTKLG